MSISIRGESLDWFSSYLINRSQFVSLHNIHSDVKNISCGVPHGSVLGPLLFLIYINDLPNISDKLEFFLSADDTNIYYEANDLDSIQRVMNNELKKLQDWLITNRLALNNTIQYNISYHYMILLNTYTYKFIIFIFNEYLYSQKAVNRLLTIRGRYKFNSHFNRGDFRW